VCQAGNAISFFPEYVAQQQGYFSAQKLSVSSPVIQVATGAKAATAVETGSCDIANGVITDAFGLAKVDASTRIIGALMDAYTADIVVSKQFEQDNHLSSTSPLTDKIQALKGKTIGITGPGSGTQALLTYVFKLAGMNASKDATQVSLGANNTAALAALQAGRVDALSFFVPIGQAAIAQGIGDIFISPLRGDIPQLVGDIHGVFYTKQSVIDAKPQAIAAYIRGIGQAEAFIHSNPTQAKAYLTKYLNLGANVADAVYTATSPVVAKDPQISQAAFTIAVDFHTTAGLVSIAPSYSQMVATSTISKALA
jgi:ABC-type nitrate/sulfonate/bicarbonate transport system substrate-binding protein